MSKDLVEGSLAVFTKLPILLSQMRLRTHGHCYTINFHQAETNQTLKNLFKIEKTAQNCETLSKFRTFINIVKSGQFGKI